MTFTKIREDWIQMDGALSATSYIQQYILQETSRGRPGSQSKGCSLVPLVELYVEHDGPEHLVGVDQDGLCVQRRAGQQGQLGRLSLGRRQILR